MQTTETQAPATPANDSTAPEYYGSATYCPEDNKLRLYVGRVPRSDYERLRAMGWTSTPKQSCDFVAHWTPERRDLCIEWCGSIEDEDQSPQERAAERAARFGGYRDRRTAEATGHADRYDAGPQAHGYQDRGRAARAADRHDRIAGRAVDSWSKAEYWTQRTAGVISHALHICAPSVRMGRIKELEAEIRKYEAGRDERAKRRAIWELIAGMSDAQAQNERAAQFAGTVSGWVEYQHPRDPARCPSSLYTLLTSENNPITGAEAAALYLAAHPVEAVDGDWLTHARFRLAYENQMLEAQGGRAGVVEMEIGGTFKGGVIAKINKSNATGRVVSVAVIMPRVEGWAYQVANEPGTPFALMQIEAERAAPGAYQPPTDTSRAKLAEFQDAKKAAATARKATRTPCPLINPTDEDAERLQAIWNERAKIEHARLSRGYGQPFKPAEVCRVPQAVYSANSKGSYAKAETRDLCALGELKSRHSGLHSSSAVAHDKQIGPAVCSIRVTGFDPYRVVVLTDKPQKPIPAAVWQPYAAPAAAPSVETVNA